MYDVYVFKLQKRYDREVLIYDIEPLITHAYSLAKIDEAYELFENKRDGVIKISVEFK